MRFSMLMLSRNTHAIIKLLDSYSLIAIKFNNRRIYCTDKRGRVHERI